MSLFCSVIMTFCVEIICIPNQQFRERIAHLIHTKNKTMHPVCKCFKNQSESFEKTEAGATVNVELCQKQEATHLKPCAVKQLSPLVAK